MEYGKELLKGSTDTLLLSLLKDQPMYGYQIIRELESRSGGYFKFREGTLYPALHRLEAAKLVRGSLEEASVRKGKAILSTDREGSRTSRTEGGRVARFLVSRQAHHGAG